MPADEAPVRHPFRELVSLKDNTTMTQDSTTPRSTSQDMGRELAPQDGTKLSWEAPAIVWHAPINSQTKGFGLNFGDGLSNLS